MIQNAANNKELALKTQGTNTVKVHCVHSPQPLLNHNKKMIMGSTLEVKMKAREFQGCSAPPEIV
jgi:hypothetical protein